MSDAQTPFRSTLALIKSQAIVDGLEVAILRRIVGPFFIKTMGRVRFTDEIASKFYAEHKGRPYFPGLIRSVTGSYGVTFLHLEADDAIAAWRRFIGATDPTKAEPGTIRRDFGRAMPDNAVHGSDSPESFQRELAICSSLPRLMMTNHEPAGPEPR